ALRHLAAVIHAIRPQWDTPGIRSALEAALTRHGYPDVAAVAVSSARDPSAATPGVITHRLRNGWTATSRDDTPPATPDNTRLEGRCRRCGFWTVRGEQHTCQRRADPEHVAAVRQRIRQ